MMDPQQDKHIVDHAAELDDSYEPDAAPQEPDAEAPPEEKPAATDTADSDTRRQAAQKEYERKLASGDLNRIDGID